MSTRILPTAPEFAREAIIVVGGAILAALVWQALPKLRAWVAARSPK